MEKILRLVRRLLESDDPRRFPDEVVDVAVELAGAERGMLIMKDGDESPLSLVSARNVDRESLKGREARLSLNMAQSTIDGRGTLLLEDAQRSEGFSRLDSVAQLGVRSVLATPIWVSGEPAGALYVDSRFIPAAFGEEEARQLETLAAIYSLFLWQGRTAEGLAAARRESEKLLSEVARLEQEVEEFRQAGRAAASIGDGQKTPPGRFAPMIGESPVMRRVYSIIEKVLDNDVTVLIQGESGTGKELVARAIHEHGRRRDRPMVAINCSSIPATLIESELFGHMKGAFTGATRDKKGLFEVADKGVLFLDEVGDMPLEMQGKLLRTLQYGEIQPLGSVTLRKVDVRVLAATNRRLEQRVAEGAFREDLYYRLNIVSIDVPPLRERSGDLPLLVEHFLAENRRQGISQVTGITPQALHLLSHHLWPGNVRELETVLKSSCLFAESETLDVSDFSALEPGRQAPASSPDGIAIQGRTLEDVERDLILSTLKAQNGNKKRTAELLGIDRRTLYNKLHRYGEM